MLNNIYFYIIPGALFLSFLYIIFLLGSKQNTYDKIEKNFDSNLEKLMFKSEKNLDLLVKHYTTNLSKTIDNFDRNNITKFEKIQEEMNVIRNCLGEFVDHFYKIKEQNEDLVQNIIQANNEIRKRDAIIDRKIKQIKRLKNEI